MYRLLERKRNSYQNFEEEYVEVDAVPLKLPDNFSEVSLPNNVKSVVVPGTVKKLVDDFCQSYSKINNLRLISLIAGAQNLYRTYSEINSPESLVNQYENLKKDLSYLLSLMKEYQFGDRNFTSDVRLKHKKHTINNFFLIDDMFKALLDYYELDVDSPQDFEMRTEELLGGTNQLKYSKALAYSKIIVAEAFNYILRDLNINNHTRHIYIGVFFNCAQIPLERTNNQLLSPLFKDNLNETSPKNIWNLLNRPPDTKL